MRLFGAVVSLLAFLHFSIMAQTDRPGVDLVMPTDNDALFSGNGPAFYQYVERDFKGVKSTPWEGGQYGFVRDPVETSAGVVYTSFHEGIDVKPLRRDARDEPLDEVRAIRDGGGNGSIIGRNTFQRPRDEALKLLDSIIKIYKGEI